MGDGGPCQEMGKNAVHFGQVSMDDRRTLQRFWHELNVQAAQERAYREAQVLLDRSMVGLNPTVYTLRVRPEGEPPHVQTQDASRVEWLASGPLCPFPICH